MSEPEYIDDIELSKRMDVSRSAIQTWRRRGEGPPFYRIGRRCRYEWSEVKQWIQNQRVGVAV